MGISSVSCWFRLKYPKRRLKVPSAFLNQPSNAGVTPNPDVIRPTIMVDCDWGVGCDCGEASLAAPNTAIGTQPRATQNRDTMLSSSDSLVVTIARPCWPQQHACGSPPTR